MLFILHFTDLPRAQELGHYKISYIRPKFVSYHCHTKRQQQQLLLHQYLMAKLPGGALFHLLTTFANEPWLFALIAIIGLIS